MAETVKQSSLLGKFPVTIVPNGIDTSVFAPCNVHAARYALGIPEQRRVLLFASDLVTNRRKGFALLAAALHQMRNINNLFLVSVGGGAPKIELDIPHLHLGRIDDDRRLALVYSAADIYVIPSLQDNQPNTALEAMACGTPVIGFDVGGIPDMVRPGVTGLLAPAANVRGLSAAIAEMLQSPQMRIEMEESCRRVVMAEYTLERQVRQYIDLYTAALERLSPGRLGGSRKIPGGSSLKATEGLLVDRVTTPDGLATQ
jgi:glycosyltransferase involved in cell wall biosynthesis